MVVLIFMLILSVGLRVDGSELDDAFDNFLSSHSSSKAYEDNSIAVKNLYKLYKNEFKRPSLTSDEENVRYSSFNNTVLNLLKHHQQGDQTYTLGLNKYADWTQDELKYLRGLRRPNGKIIGTNDKPNQRFLSLDGKEIQSKAATALPSSFDYTTQVVSGTKTPILTPIKDQGQCGSCYAFAFVTLLEAQYAFQSKTSANFSEQQIVDCSTYDAGCNGGYFTNTFWYLQNNNWQINSGLSYPYKAKAATCAFTSTGCGGVKFGSLLSRNLPNDTDVIQQALYYYGPIWVSLFAGDQTNSIYKTISTIFSYYTGGVIKPTGCPTSSDAANHAVAIVGYGVDTKTNLPYWKVRNSWGYWGEQGYFRIQRGVNMCGIESAAYFIGKPSA